MRNDSIKSNYIAGRLDCVDKLSAQLLHANLLGGLPASNGHWSGEMGNSLWLPDLDFMPKNKQYSNLNGKSWRQILSDYGCEEGIWFTNGEIDFAKTGVVKAEVTIPEGIGTCFSDCELECGKRTRLHDTSFAILAERLGKTVEEVMKWKDKNIYMWHECIDLHTVQLVPQEIHGNLTHQGGVAILRLVANN